MAATFVRRNVHRLGDPWAPQVLWYARGVEALQKRALDDPTSWRFLAGIHGFDQNLWAGFGAFGPADRLPKKAVRDDYWNQCQHASWYFLPWHRGYLIAFEALIRAAVVGLGGPADWALPYWNYANTGESRLPAAFASPDWPDGQGSNPLFVEQRYGLRGDGVVRIPVQVIDLNALAEPDFSGVGGGGSPGFGGVDTGFWHGGGVHGSLESQPHDIVHVLVGGFEDEDLTQPGDRDNPGVMSVPDSAGLDPIFWLHHANIDRLWQTWRGDPPVHQDPTDPRWLTGPARRGFVAPKPDGTPWRYTAEEVHLLSEQDYEYDDLSPGSAIVPPPTPEGRRARLGRPEAVPERQGDEVAEHEVELVGANRAEVPVVGGRIETAVDIDVAAGDRVTESLEAARRPDRIFLNLENVRGRADATVLQVYVALPEGADPAEHPERRAGSVGLFGLRSASDPDGEQAGQGLTFVLEITRIVDDLHLDASVDGTLGQQLDVTVVPMRPVAAREEVSIGRISVFRQTT